MNTNDNAAQFLTPQDLVKRWAGAVTVGTLANWRAQGTGPAFTKIGARVRYALEAVVKYEQQNQIGAAGEGAAA